MKKVLKKAVFAILVASVSTSPVFGEKLVSSGLCSWQNLDMRTYKCQDGLLRQEGIEVNHQEIKKICLLSVINTSKNEMITHAWYFNGRHTPLAEPTVWDEEKRSFLEGVSEEIDKNSSLGPQTWL